MRLTGTLEANEGAPMNRSNQPHEEKTSRVHYSGEYLSSAEVSMVSFELSKDTKISSELAGNSIPPAPPNTPERKKRLKPQR